MIESFVLYFETHFIYILSYRIFEYLGQTWTTIGT
jgi:hypothetical protein